MLERAEVDVRELDRQARAAGQRVYYPCAESAGARAGFRRVEQVTELALRNHGFAEPPPELPRARADEIDLVVAPALAATPRGERLGQGGGFYDAILTEFCPPARCLVVVYELQLRERLPWEPHDRRCDVVATEQRVLTAG
jgi:5-formyltetrahydrofolate cyclo-ligase